MDLVQKGLDKHLLADSAVKDLEYVTGKQLLVNMFDEAKTSSNKLPSKEDHDAIAERLGLADMGKFVEPTVQEDSKGSIPLWSRAMLESDENQRVIIFF